jgi:hypothetical protein
MFVYQPRSLNKQQHQTLTTQMDTVDGAGPHQPVQLTGGPSYETLMMYNNNNALLQQLSSPPSLGLNQLLPPPPPVCTSVTSSTLHISFPILNYFC